MKRILRLTIGLILFSFGIVLTVNGNLGLSPWEAFHIGLSEKLNISFGQVAIIVGAAIVLLNYHLKESIGLGTLANIFVIGLIIDLIFASKLIPVMTEFLPGLMMITLGMVIIAFASYCYIGSGFGTGPRDGLMVALTRELGKPIGLIRGSIEITVLLFGYLLGAKVGIGTIILAFGIGPIVQLTFKLFKFDVQAVEHDAILAK